MLTVLWWEMIITADVIYRPKKERKKCNGEIVKERSGGRIYQVERELLEKYRNCIPTAVLWKPEILQSNYELHLFKWLWCFSCAHITQLRKNPK